MPTNPVQWFQAGFSLLTVRIISGSAFSYHSRTLQHTGHPHPVLSSPTSVISSAGSPAKRVRNATSLALGNDSLRYVSVNEHDNFTGCICNRAATPLQVRTCITILPRSNPKNLFAEDTIN